MFIEELQNPELMMSKTKGKTINIKVDKFTFTVSSFCYRKVGNTENMKFRVKCGENPAYNKEFDDVKSLTDYIGEFISTCAIDLII